MRISAPPWCYPCYFGIDTPDPAKLIGANHTVEEIASRLGVDSLGYLSTEGLLSAMPPGSGPFCLACFNGRYPMDLGEHVKEGKKKNLSIPRGLEW